ncbi:MAG: nucleotidyltransferase family protein [Thermodesulfobacteriota bacterium]|nr:nucleotidyltransferase family protein [Thermodesulfobacteriota bacterium]
MGSEIEDKLLRVIARQTLSWDDAAWLEKNMREGIDWPVVIYKAFEEGLASFLYLHCRNLGTLTNLPESSRKLLIRIYAETLLINRHMIKVLEELDEYVKRYEIQVIVLKGASLINWVYEDIGLRPMEDVDLMVRPENMYDIKRALERMGFSVDRLYPNTFRKGIISLDIHTDLLSSHRIRSRKRIMNLQYEDVWKRAVPIDNGSSIYRLSLYDNIIALSSHLLKHGFRRMIWFVDIKESIEKSGDEFNWSEMIQYSKRIQAQRLLLYIMLLSKQLMGMNVPDHILNDLGKNDLSLVEKYILRLRLTDEPLGMITEILWLFQISKQSDKVQFIMENIFPRKAIMRQIFPTTSYSRLKFLLRFIDIFSHAFRDFSSAFRIIIGGRLPLL